MRAKLLKGLLYVFIFFIAILVFNSQSVVNSKEDKQYIQAFSAEWKLQQNPDSIHADFENEIAFIRQLQESAVRSIQQVEIPHQYFGNLKFYYTNRKGFCYDRAVMMEKFFLYYGFPFRHLYLFYDPSGNYPSAANFFKRNTPSHALLEVKTKKGWMVIGTNANWIGLSSNNEVIDIKEFKKQAGANKLALKYNPSIGESFWEGKGNKFRFIYGIYSRHGDFFNSMQDTGKASLLPSFHILPDYNLSMLLENF
jgi:hypothetical protein